MSYWNGVTSWPSVDWIGGCLILMALLALACVWLMAGRRDLRCMGGPSSEADGEPENWHHEAL